MGGRRDVHLTKTDALTVEDLLDELFGEDGYTIHAHKELLSRSIALVQSPSLSGSVFARSFTLGEVDVELGPS